MWIMQQLLERVRAALAEPTECGTCGRNLEGTANLKALSAPGRYCSEFCADEATDTWAW